MASEEQLQLQSDTPPLPNGGAGSPAMRWGTSSVPAYHVKASRTRPPSSLLALVYHRLGREADAESMPQRSSTPRFIRSGGMVPKALEWLETALRLRDGGLAWLRVDPLLDPLRNQPRFQAIERALRFPKS